MIRIRIRSSVASGLVLALFAALCVGPSRLAAEEGGESESGRESAEFALMEPLITENPLPETRLRFDYALKKETHEEDALEHIMRLDAEFSPARWVSFEVQLPYVVADRDEEANRHNLADLKVIGKFASFVLEDEGVLLGGGLDLSLPTGNSQNDIGSDRLVMIEPFVNAAFSTEVFETIGALRVGIPANENSRDPDWTIGWNVALLAHLSPMFAALLELDGERGFGGEEDGETIANITPGLRWNPSDDPSLWFGTGVSVPLTNDEEFDFRWVLSAFYEF